MIELFLDGKPAIPTSNLSIKLTCENPFFTKSGEYTYDVELPIDIPQNRAIFGNICRMDIPKPDKRYRARLRVDNQSVLEGEAHITEVSHTSVKVQLLGAAAAYHFATNLDKLYIDEINLGNWLQAVPEKYLTGMTPPDLSKQSDPGCFCVWEALKGVINPEINQAKSQRELLFGDELPFVAYPTFNSTPIEEDKESFWTKNKNLFNHFFLFPTDDTSTTLAGYISSPVFDGFAPQPYVWYMAQIIANATGFSLDKEDNALWSNENLRHIFIVNATDSFFCNKGLPHWSVNEWWSNLEDTFGVIVHIDYSSRHLSISRRDKYFNETAESNFIDDIVDEYKVDLNEDTEKDVLLNEGTEKVPRVRGGH